MKKYPGSTRSLLSTAVCALALAVVASTAGAARADTFGPRAPANEAIGTDQVPPDYVPPELADVGVKEHLGDAVPLDVTLRDEQGNDVALGKYFTSGKPVALNFVYHTCPTLCSMVQSGFSASLREVPWNIGERYEVLTISIDPRDTPQIAADKKALWVKGYGRSPEQTAAGWHFLTGDERQVKKLAESVGFIYHYDPRQKQYAHSAAVFVLTPTGKIARYLYGIEFPAKDMRLALTEASEGRFVTTLDHILLYCYQYDPNARGYVLAAWRVMRLGAALTIAALGSFLGIMWLRERRKRASSAPVAPDQPHAAGGEGGATPARSPAGASVAQGAASASTTSQDLEPKLQG
jgi:protein SCO1